MTPQDLERCRALCLELREKAAKATAGPWAYNGRMSVLAVDKSGQKRVRGQRSCGDLFPSVCHNSSPPDAEFIAAARTHIEELCGLVERLLEDAK